MQSVNNCLMTNKLDIADIALEKIRNVLVMFEKKKRNLDKRKVKLEDYKKKNDLNEDQQVAVSKYPEVVSNLELLEEFTSQTNLQYKEAEKAIKRFKKQDKIDKRKRELNVLEYSFRNFNLLERVCRHEKVQAKILSENVLSTEEVSLLNGFFLDVSGDGCDWRKISEAFQSLCDGGSKKADSNNKNTDENKTDVSHNDINNILLKLTNVEWLTSNCWVDYLNESTDESTAEVERFYPSDDEAQFEESEVPQQQQQPSQEFQNTEVKEVEASPVIPQENQKMSFVFLHESCVQQSENKLSNENGYVSRTDVVPGRPDSQISEKSGGDAAGSGSGANSMSKTRPWNPTIDVSFAQQQPQQLEDVFSSATQSEFMQADNFTKAVRGGNTGNVSRGGHWQSGGGSGNAGGGRFRGGASGDFIKGQNGNSYWRGSGSGRSFNANSRYQRGGRGGSGNRGRGGSSRGGGGGGRMIDNRFAQSGGEPLSAQ